MRKTPVKMMLVAGTAALLLALIVTPQVKTANPQGSDVLTQALGGTAGLASDAAFNQAETYFHAGISGGCNHIGETAKEHQSHDSLDSDLPLMGLIRQLHGETAPKEHRHLEGKEERELLPWFEAAVRLDPKNVDAWITGSYFFYRTGKKDKALEFISNGVRENPKDYRVYMERGALYHRLGNWKRAANDLEKADSLCTVRTEDAVLDKRAIRRYLSDSQGRLKTCAQVD